MENKQSLLFDKDIFLKSNWKKIVNDCERQYYSSISTEFNKAAVVLDGEGQNNEAGMFRLLSRACSMMFNVKSINEPFKPIFQDFQEGKRSAIADDFTIDELAFFESILNDIDEPWLQARLADLLWLCRKPKKPDHARIAVNAYTAHEINSESWRHDIDDCWERAARICLQIKDYDKLTDITQKLYEAFQQEYPDNSFMYLWLARLLDDLNIDKELRVDIAEKLSIEALKLEGSGNFDGARSYLELAAKKYQQSDNEDKWLDSLMLCAEYFVKEANSRVAGSQMVANTFYENAIQAFRRIPVKHRNKYDVENKIRDVRDKIVETGQASLGEMGLVKTPGVDISDIVKSSIEHVSGKESLKMALLYFSGLYSGPNYESLKVSATKIMRDNPISTLFGSTTMASDGRVVGKTPRLNLNAGEDDPDNQAILNQQIQRQFTFEMQLVVEGNILPALRQLLMEYRFTPAILESLCYHSPFIPTNREKLTAYALWLGFEYDFSNAIHLLCPQFEHMIRMQLKDAGAHTTTIDPSGIESENGLSTLLELTEAKDLFGQNTLFEMKSIFTDSLGHNLRNEVAHGLLDDQSSNSLSSVYAWWMFFRLIIQPLMTK